MNDLIQQIEGAQSEAPSLFHHAYEAVFGCTPWSDLYESGSLGSRTDKVVRERAQRFADLVRAGAWLDAAMTLVPKGWYLELKGPRAYLNIPTPVPNYWSANLSTFDYEGQKMGWAATPALALCASALRASDGETG